MKARGRPRIGQLVHLEFDLAHTYAVEVIVDVTVDAVPLAADPKSPTTSDRLS